MPDTATLQITMPEMGESVTEGIVLEWHVAVGDFVNEGDTVVEVSTDKVDAEVPAPASGTITALVVEVDDEVPVGAPLAEMAPGDGRAGGAPAAGPAADAGSSSSQAAGEDPASASPAGGNASRSTAATGRRPTGPMSKPRRSRAGWRKRKGSTWVRSRRPASAARSPKRTCSTAAMAPATAPPLRPPARRSSCAAPRRCSPKRWTRAARSPPRPPSARSPSTPSTPSARRSTPSSKSAA